ncbi:transposase [Nitrosospira multiformis]|nr:transposase [Nitrosospira multiformis]
MATRRKYAAEFKQEAVQLVRSANVPASQIARDLGIDPNMLSRWCREMDSVGNKAFQGQGRPRDEEMGALKRELIQVRKERDFLREAAAFFAKASK